MQLPLLKNIDMLATKWKAIIDPMLSNPMSNMTVLERVLLASGENQIPHKLGRNQQGWVITDTNAAVTIYRSKPFSDTYLYLTASGAVTINLGVF
jgi:hypothetical protein